MLGAVSAAALPPAEAPDLFTTVAAAARRLRIPPPRLAISRTSTPFALVVGRGRERTTLCVSSGLLADLDADGLLVVVTHQLTHAAGPLVLPRTVASAWAAGLLRATDGAPLLSVANPVGLLVRRLGVTAAQQTEADERRRGRWPIRMRCRGSWPGSMPVSAERRCHRRGRSWAVAGLMITSPFGNDVRAAQLAGQPDTRARLLRLEQSAAAAPQGQR